MSKIKAHHHFLLIHVFTTTGDIGGSAGLFVGASLITLFEILDILCHGFCLIKNKLMRKSKQPKALQPNTISHFNGNRAALNDPNEIYWVNYNGRLFRSQSGELTKDGRRLSETLLKCPQ